MKQRILLMVGFVGATLFRLIPFRPPNMEPLLSIMMPFSKKVGAFELAIFGFLSIVLHDSLTVGIGSHTWSAGGIYAVLGLVSCTYFKNRAFSSTSFTTFSVASILFFDIMTGVVLGPIISGGSFVVAFVGQIPFTALHLMGGVFFALTLSPLIEKALAKSSISVLEHRKCLQK
jgi:hypothetical protein